jgi:prepilin-type N-terminal cleavage/methylation domain-containing protein
MRRRGFSLVEILVVVVILLIILAILAPRYLGGGKGPGGKPIESPMQRGRSVECINNLSQLRGALQIATLEEDAQRPQTLRDVGRGFPESMFSCPVGKQPYSYDPARGKIWCVQPGHESY